VIIGIPAFNPVRTPVEGTIDASAGLLLVHVPPDGVELSVVVKPVHTVIVPVIADGLALTVITAEVVHPVGNAYTIDGVPAEPPVTTPVSEPTAACAVLVLLQVPPDVAELTAMDEPTQTEPGPVIPLGNAFTVTVVIVLQPVANVYVITGIPADAPVTTPLPLTVA